MNFSSKIFIFQQWKQLKIKCLILARMTRDFFAVNSVDVSCERLFSVSSRIYAFYKFYDFSTLWALMLFRSYNFKKNKLKQLSSDLKNAVKKAIKEIRKELNKWIKNSLKSYNVKYINSDDNDDNVNQRTLSKSVICNKNF